MGMGYDLTPRPGPFSGVENARLKALEDAAKGQITNTDKVGTGPGTSGGGGGGSVIPDMIDMGSKDGYGGHTGEGFEAGVGSLYDWLPSQERFNQLSGDQRLAALISATIRRNEQGLDAGLAGFDASQAERLERGGGLRELEDRVLGDTDVMDEGTIQNIAGQVTQGANQKASVLGRALSERRAAAGSSRSGSAQTEQAQTLQNAMNTAINAESQMRGQAREANFGSRLQALQGVGGSQREDVRLGAGIAESKAALLQKGNVNANAFATANVFNNAPMKQPVVWEDGQMTVGG